MSTADWYAVHGPNGDLTWRVTGPAEAIGAKLHLVPQKHGTRVMWPNTGKFFPWHMVAEFEDGTKTWLKSEARWKQFNSQPRRLRSLKAVYPSHKGEVAVFTRPMAWLAVHMLQMKEQGIRVCAEVDDNYLSPANLNFFMKTGYQDRTYDEHSRSMCTADAILFSTGYLRDTYHRELRKIFPGLRLPELHVCRNHVDERHIPTPLPKQDKIRVGYMGSDSHVWDVELAYPALAAAKQAGCEIVFVGIHPAKINRKHFRHHWDWDALQYTHIPWSLDYRGTALPLDIGLAPLMVDKHTLCKSDIKALEYALSGAACVAQNCLVYNRTLKHGENVLFAGSPGEFVTQTMALVGNEKLRDDLAKNCLDYVMEERLLKDNADEWKQAIFG